MRCCRPERSVSHVASARSTPSRRERVDRRSPPHPRRRHVRHPRPYGGEGGDNGLDPVGVGPHAPRQTGGLRRMWRRHGRRPFGVREWTGGPPFTRGVGTRATLVPIWRGGRRQRIRSGWGRPPTRQAHRILRIRGSIGRPGGVAPFSPTSGRAPPSHLRGCRTRAQPWRAERIPPA